MVPALLAAVDKPATFSTAEGSPRAGGRVFDDKREGIVGRGAERVAGGEWLEEYPSEQESCVERCGTFCVQYGCSLVTAYVIAF